MNTEWVILGLMLAGGNPGAISVVRQLDDQHIETLAVLRVHNSTIWWLFKDKCGEDINVLKRVLEKAWETRDLHEAIKAEGL